MNGSALPDVDFDVGESYAGLLPISGAANETRELFFWFFPSTNTNATEEIAIWFNGGPGCSSLSGLLTENGPVSDPSMYVCSQTLISAVHLGGRNIGARSKSLHLGQSHQHALG